MKNLMMTLLTYEPAGKMSQEEQDFVTNILTNNSAQEPSMLSELFSDFYAHVKKDNLDDIERLRQWREKYYGNNKSKKEYPLIFKKICFYIMVRGSLTDKEFMIVIGLRENCLRKWGISTQFRKYAEADTYSCIKSYRNGMKKEYVVSLIKKLYYEAGRQQNVTIVLNKLPAFVDVMAGTASVAASVVSEGCPFPVVNDYDPLLVCYAWAFTYCQKEIKIRLARKHNELMKQKFDNKKWDYSEEDYKNHMKAERVYSKMTLADDNFEEKEDEAWERESLSNPEYWDIKYVQLGETKEFIQKSRKKAQHYMEFIIKIRSSFLEAEKIVKNYDRDSLRSIDFDQLTKYAIKRQITDAMRKVINLAIAVFYYYSFSSNGKNGNAYNVTSIDEESYFRYLHTSLHVPLTWEKGENKMDMADKGGLLLRLRLAYKNKGKNGEKKTLDLSYKGAFSKNLRGAEFCVQDFRDLVKNQSHEKIFYFDSEYFLTAGYHVEFNDEHHKALLDVVRNADFKWIFSMQYNPAARDKCTTDSDSAKRRKLPHIIKNYGAYYRGFQHPLILDESGKYYVPDNGSCHEGQSLFVVLFDFDKVTDKWKNASVTKEMLVVNFPCVRCIPYDDIAVALPFEQFIECADRGMQYAKIVEKAKAWRETNIAQNIGNENPL